MNRSGPFQEFRTVAANTLPCLPFSTTRAPLLPNCVGMDVRGSKSGVKGVRKPSPVTSSTGRNPLDARHVVPELLHVSLALRRTLLKELRAGAVRVLRPGLQESACKKVLCTSFPVQKNVFKYTGEKGIRIHFHLLCCRCSSAATRGTVCENCCVNEAASAFSTQQSSRNFRCVRSRDLSICPVPFVWFTAPVEARLVDALLRLLDGDVLEPRDGARRRARLAPGTNWKPKAGDIDAKKVSCTSVLSCSSCISRLQARQSQVSHTAMQKQKQKTSENHSEWPSFVPKRRGLRELGSRRTPPAPARRGEPGDRASSREPFFSEPCAASSGVH